MREDGEKRVCACVIVRVCVRACKAWVHEYLSVGVKSQAVDWQVLFSVFASASPPLLDLRCEKTLSLPVPLGKAMIAFRCCF